MIMMKEKLKLEKYFKDFNSLLKSETNQNFTKIIDVKKELIRTKQRRKKILIFGNGGSSSIASHFSVDLTKNAKIRCVNFNEHNLLTCFSNDYGFDKWIEKALNFYGDKGDTIILISSSGKSKNMIRASIAAKKKSIKIITLTGMDKNNPLKKSGNINLWVNSKAYNFIENIHQIWLLSIVDSIIGKNIYSSNR
tara:strand:+ start:1453 stop:2034 length:582 start_codon:yes stop_codon:yes gene_type:complete